MTDKPILFSRPMVRAILDGRKTMTRRVLNPLPRRTIFFDPKTAGLDQFQPPRYAIGDRLYVREAWRTHAEYDDMSPAAMGGDEPIEYQADGAHQTWGYPAISKIGRVRQGMHMPRWASRITLIVTDVRVQRLQEISEGDAEAEGWPPPDERATTGIAEIKDAYPIGWFAWLWDSLNDKRGYGWGANPWVAALTFDVIKQNIDQIEGAAV